MKRHFILIAVIKFMVIPASAQALLKVNPGGLLLGLGSGSVEYFATSRLSIQLDGYLLRGLERNNIQFAGAGIGFAGRLYAGTNTRPTGLFLSPYVAQYFLRFDDLRSVSHQYSFTAIGGQLGYQQTIKEILTIEAGGGIWTGINISTNKQAFGVTEYFGQGVNVWLNLGVGLIIWK